MSGSDVMLEDLSTCGEEDVARLDEPTASSLDSKSTGSVGVSSSSSAAGRPSRVSPRHVAYHSLRYVRVVLLPFVIVTFWLGAWNLFDVYLWGHLAFYQDGYVWRDMAYLLAGVAGLIAVKAVWSHFKFEDEKDRFGLPKFSWKPRLWRWSSAADATA